MNTFFWNRMASHHIVHSNVCLDLHERKTNKRTTKQIANVSHYPLFSVWIRIKTNGATFLTDSKLGFVFIKHLLPLLLLLRFVFLPVTCECECECKWKCLGVFVRSDTLMKISSSAINYTKCWHFATNAIRIPLSQIIFKSTFTEVMVTTLTATNNTRKPYQINANIARKK